MKILKFIIASIIFINSAYSQAPSIEWQKCYGTSVAERCQCIQPTSDGGSIACGRGQTSSVWVIKIDVSGNLQWQQSYPASEANSIQQTTDGGFIVAGSKNATAHGSDFWIARLNSLGNIVWEKTFGGSINDIAHCVQQTADAGFIVAGRIASSDGDITGFHGMNDGWILKLDDLGNLIWQKTLGGSNFDVIQSIKQTSDGGYIAGGDADSMDGDVTNNIFTSPANWVVKLDNIGNIVWQKTYGSSFGLEGIFGICITNDGGYAFVSGCYENSGDVSGHIGAEDLWIVKVDNVGNIIWQRPTGGTSSEVPLAISATLDGGCVAVGYTASNNGDVTGFHGATDFLVAKLSATGALEWTKLLGGDAHDRPYSVYQTAANSYMVAGLTGSNNNGDVGSNNGQEDFWIVKLTFPIIPVTLSHFTASPRTNDVVCQWETLQEQNLANFNIERSEDGINFITAAIITATGNSLVPLFYGFTDKNVMSKSSEYLYYRLKMVDIDRSSKYSNIIKVKTKNILTISIYPNPAIDILTIDFNAQIKEDAVINIISYLGEKLFEQKITIKQGKNLIPLNIISLPEGVYTLSINGKNKYFVKFIKSIK